MKPSMLISLVGTVILSVLFSGAVLAQSRSDEAQLQALQNEMDKDFDQGQAGRGSKSQVDVLARQFHVPGSVVEDLRSKKQGWGVIAIELAMAQHLSKIDLITYARSPRRCRG